MDTFRVFLLMVPIYDKDVLAPKTVSVSVVCANYNDGNYLPDMIDSIRLSSVLPTELIIVDDGSTDNSLEILESYAHLPYLRIVSTKHQGLAAALNTGIQLAKSDFIMRIDADDYVYEDRIKLQVAYLLEHEDIALVGGNVCYFEHGSGKIINRSNFPGSYQGIRRRFKNGENGMLHGTIMARREILSEYTFEQKLVPVEDYALFAQMIKAGHKFINLPQVLTYVRVKSNRISSQLQYEAIEKQFRLRDQLFGTRSSTSKIWVYYVHLYGYQKYLLSRDSSFRWFYLTISALARPKKLLNRIFRNT